jgi:hypothetical protein
MPTGRLSTLQVRLLELLADMSPPWTLTGGAALVGFYTDHRTTRDLDLRWSGRSDVPQVARDVADRLRSAGLDVVALQSSRSFGRLRAAEGDEVVLIDIMADPVPPIDEPSVRTLGTVRLRVDSQHEILVDKLCALLGRMELRDLQDVRALLHAGGDLHRALRDAPRKDGGFSPLALAWALQGLPADRLATAAGWAPEDAEAIEEFRGTLIAQLLASAAPG